MADHPNTLLAAVPEADRSAEYLRLGRSQGIDCIRSDDDTVRAVTVAAEVDAGAALFVLARDEESGGGW